MAAASHWDVRAAVWTPGGTGSGDVPGGGEGREPTGPGLPRTPRRGPPEAG